MNLEFEPQILEVNRNFKRPVRFSLYNHYYRSELKKI